MLLISLRRPCVGSVPDHRSARMERAGVASWQQHKQPKASRGSAGLAIVFGNVARAMQSTTARRRKHVALVKIVMRVGVKLAMLQTSYRRLCVVSVQQHYYQRL